MTTNGEELNARVRAMWSAVDYNPIATRETLVSELLVRHAEVHAGERVLDVASGTGNTALAAARRDAVVTASDLVPANLERAASRAEVEGLRLRFEVGDAQDLPFEDASFDSALMDNVLEHIADPAALMLELRRVLRPEGLLLIGVPGVLGWDSDSDHKVRYDEASLGATLNSHDFVPIEVFYTPLWQSAWLSRHLRQYCIFALYGNLRPGASVAQPTDR